MLGFVTRYGTSPLGELFVVFAGPLECLGAVSQLRTHHDETASSPNTRSINGQVGTAEWASTDITNARSRCWTR